MYSDFSSTLYLCKHRFLIIDIPLQKDTVEKPTLKFTLCVLQFIDLDKHIMTCICHYNIIQNNLTALKVLCGMLINSSVFPNPWKPLIFFCHHCFDFSKRSPGWNHTVYSLYVSFHNMHLSFVLILTDHFFSVLSNMPLLGCTRVYSSIHL
jgi:hypothetical protein